MWRTVMDKVIHMNSNPDAELQIRRTLETLTARGVDEATEGVLLLVETAADFSVLRLAVATYRVLQQQTEREKQTLYKDFLHKLHQVFKPRSTDGSWLDDLMHRAAFEDDRATIDKLIHDSAAEQWRTVCLARSAAMGGHTRLAEDLIGVNCGTYANACIGAAAGGHIETFKHFWNDNMVTIVPDMLSAAVFSGSRSMIRHLSTIAPLTLNTNECLVSAAGGGQFDLCQLYFDGASSVARGTALQRAAGKCGSTEGAKMFAWLLQHCTSSSSRTATLADGDRKAAVNRCLLKLAVSGQPRYHVESVRHLIEHHGADPNLLLPITAPLLWWLCSAPLASEDSKSASTSKRRLQFATVCNLVQKHGLTNLSFLCPHGALSDECLLSFLVRKFDLMSLQCASPTQNRDMLARLCDLTSELHQIFMPSVLATVVLRYI
jgi:hypothetical protein